MARIPQLVRDNMPPRESTGEIVVKVPPAYAMALLVAKIHAEAEEVARDATNPEEYADVLESLMCLAQMNGLAWSDVEAALLEKRGRKGALAAGHLWIPKEYLDDYRNEEAA